MGDSEELCVEGDIEKLFFILVCSTIRHDYVMSLMRLAYIHIKEGVIIETYDSGGVYRSVSY